MAMKKKIFKSKNKEPKKESCPSKSKQKNLVKIIGVCILVASCSSTSFFIGKKVGIDSPATSKHYFSLNNALATVNGEEIPFKSFKAFMNIYFYMNKTQKFTDEEIFNYESDTIEYLTLNKAIYDDAIKNNISVDDSTVKENYSSFMEDLTTKLNLDKDSILKKFDLTEDFILEKIKEQTVIDEYLKQIADTSEEEALKYYNENPDGFHEYKTSHILVSTKDSDGKELSQEEKEKAYQKALDFLNQIKDGGNFEEIAKLYSDRMNEFDDSPKNGGDLGYLSKNQFNEKLLTALNKIEAGDLYPDIVETESGYHIIKKTDERIVDFEDEKESIIDSLSYDKQQKFLEQLRKDADIKVLYNH